jgi:two-component system OmpR family sensor kinase
VARRLGWAGLGFFIGGSFLAFALHFVFPSTLMKFRFQIDPAVLILVITFLIASGLLGLSAFIYRQQSGTKQALIEQAASLEEEQRRFIRRLDHELKNPLTAIQVQLDNLQETKAKMLPALDEVRAQANRLSLLTRGLRRLADLETRALEKESVDVEELLNEVIDLLQAPERIHLDIQKLPWPIPPIEGDRELLLLAFRNLAENALIYSADPIHIKAHHTSGHLVVEVIDTGRGIPTEELPLITEELYRGSNVQEVSGSGLGLSIVERVISRHSGRLELRSRPEQGTIATIHLPYEETGNL